MDQIAAEKVAAGLPLLKTSGNRIVNVCDGSVVRLRGVNWSGFEYHAEAHIDDLVLDEIALWGANVIRLPFNQEWALTRESYRCAMDDTIERAAHRGLYTLLDLQWLDSSIIRGHLADGRPNFVPALPNEKSTDVWRILAARYKSNDAVLFDIFNEPHDPLPDDDTFPSRPRKVRVRQWHPWARRLVETIRSEHANALIFISGLDWGYDLSSFPMADVQGVVYSSHVYPNKQKSWERAFGQVSRTHPIFVAEFGGLHENLIWGTELIEYLERLEIGWCAWSWCDHPRLIVPRTDTLPTAFGMLVRERMQSAKINLNA